jgi:hypothetical protein
MLKRFRRRERSLDPSYEQRLEALEERVSYLDELLVGLQDSVHRESIRRDDETAEMRRGMTPRELARALSEDARRRGLE